MRTEVIIADSIDAAVERILDELKEDGNATRSISSTNNVIYFDGWDGLGASAVLGAVAQRLAVAPEAPAEGLQFDQILHVDCSKWESRRSLQRAIAEQLQLPADVTEMFDKQDEEDDFDGLAEGSRTEIEIPQVLRAMYQHIQKLNRRFLVIFHNGSSEEIDLDTFGFLTRYSNNKVLWTFQGRLRLYPRAKVDGAMELTGKTDVFLSASASQEKDAAAQALWSLLVRQEATELTLEDAGSSVVEPSKVAECFLYMMKLCCLGHLSGMDYDIPTHGCNYWICDGVIQLEHGGGGDDGSWRVADALRHEMRLDADYYHHRDQPPLPSHLVTMASIPCFASPYGVLRISSADLLQHIDKLGVLKLSHCAFSIPVLTALLYKHRLKFLWLDHCQDQVTSTNGEGEEEEEDIRRRCFQRLWVLDLRYTCCDRILSARMLDAMARLRELNVMGAQDWDIGQLRGRLPILRKLRVTKSTVACTSSSGNNNLMLGMNKMELLDFSGNRTIIMLSEISISSNHLETVMITDGCVGIQKFSFRGCAKLKNLLLSGSFEHLRSLDLSGTAVKTLDLSAMTAGNLDELFLEGCEKLCAILWPPKDNRKEYLGELRIDTTQSNEGRTAQEPSDLSWYIALKDARLLRSVVPCRKYFEDHQVHVEISSPGRPAVNVGGTKTEAVIKSGIGSEQPNMPQQQTEDNEFIYADVADKIKGHLFQASEGNNGHAQAITQIQPCPDAPSLRSSDCYMHIQDNEEYTTGSIITIPDFVCDRAWILHVHDSLSITSIPGPARWYRLAWCRVERCPKLDFVFTVPQLGSGRSDVRIFYWLQALWASQLPKARYMWDMSKLPLRHIHTRSFEDLKLLHLDFCPRLIHVVPFSTEIINRRWLETIEIVWCGDLRTVFPSLIDTESHQEEQPTVKFPNLKCIHLHELPRLQSICGSRRMLAPNLETVKIRGCWSLKRLPAVSSDGSNEVECDCEKDWWDKLEWDGLDAGHHPSLYKPTHSRYYKKTLLRGSVLI